MGSTRTEIVDGKEITIVEDSREDIQDFLGMAQEIEELDEEEQQKRVDEIFGSEEELEVDTDQEEQKEELSEEAQERKDEILSRQSSRANTDVALAMQIADQVAADSAVENPCYVVHGLKFCALRAPEKHVW